MLLATHSSRTTRTLQHLGAVCFEVLLCEMRVIQHAPGSWPVLECLMRICNLVPTASTHGPRVESRLIILLSLIVEAHVNQQHAIPS